MTTFVLDYLMFAWPFLAAFLFALLLMWDGEAW